MNTISADFDMGTCLAAKIIFFLGLCGYFATDAKRMAKNFHVTMLTPLPIELAIFYVHSYLIFIHIIGCGINPAHRFKRYSLKPLAN